MTVLQLDGRSLIDIFMSLPSRKEYPDYYQVISEPIDMATIEQKIRMDKVSPHSHYCVLMLRQTFMGLKRSRQDGCSHSSTTVCATSCNALLAILSVSLCLQYGNTTALVHDLELMFNNARHYNQETSQVYKDAETLERILKLRVRSFPSLAGVDASSPGGLDKQYVMPALQLKPSLVVL